MKKPFILFVLRKRGVRREIFESLVRKLERCNFVVERTELFALGDRKKFCEEFYPESFAKYSRQILDSYPHRVVAILVGARKGSKAIEEGAHLRVKRALRDKYGQDVVHCSDDPASAVREYNILRNSKKKFFEERGGKRGY
jgi:hypothetical protein